MADTESLDVYRIENTDYEVRKGGFIFTVYLCNWLLITSVYRYQHQICQCQCSISVRCQVSQVRCQVAHVVSPVTNVNSPIHNVATSIIFLFRIFFWSLQTILLCILRDLAGREYVDQVVLKQEIWLSGALCQDRHTQNNF